MGRRLKAEEGGGGSVTALCAAVTSHLGNLSACRARNICAKACDNARTSLTSTLMAHSCVMNASCSGGESL